MHVHCTIYICYNKNANWLQVEQSLQVYLRKNIVDKDLSWMQSTCSRHNSVGMCWKIVENTTKLDGQIAASKQL